jgi:hypothetical protein
MLTQAADGVWVRQSEWVWTNSIVVHVEDGLILIDPGIHGSELNQLADEVDRLGIPVVAGFSTIPTGTTCSGIPGSATCRASPPPPPPTLPVKPESSSRRGRRRKRPAFLST